MSVNHTNAPCCIGMVACNMSYLHFSPYHHFLFSARKEEAEAKRVAAAEAAAKKKRDAEAKKAAAQAQKTVEKAPPGATINLFGGLGGGGKAAAPPPAPVQAPKPAASARKTISLFGAGGNDQVKAEPSTMKKASTATAKKAPAGVPSIVKWKKNRDGSVTGFISGSPAFDEGEKITTSPITKGDISSGQTVQTGSGSRYFLV